MLCVIQRVESASVTIVSTGEHHRINKGLVLLVGIEKDDTEKDVLWLTEKIVNLRIFKDTSSLSHKEFDKSIKDINGEILAVPEFTLLGDCNKGRRPNFILAEKHEPARILYEKFVFSLKNLLGDSNKVKNGTFGTEMLVEINNNGPVTFIINSKK